MPHYQVRATRANGAVMTFGLESGPENVVDRVRDSLPEALRAEFCWGSADVTELERPHDRSKPPAEAELEQAEAP